MTKKDYVAVATALHAAKPTRRGADTRYGADPACDVWGDCVNAIARCFESDNPRFDPQTFDAACEHGMESPEYKATIKRLRALNRNLSAV